MIIESLMCLALNVYHEAKNQSFIGQVAVAQVVMNRVKDSRYPNNVCDVVKQGLTYKWNPSIPIKNQCQFSLLRVQHITMLTMLHLVGQRLRLI
jgi:spore germination cell wall hydrolase CwlJ-like protein